MKTTFNFRILRWLAVLVVLTGVLLPAGRVAASPPGQQNADLTFYDLGMDFPVSLNGPVSETSLQFNLPADWEPAGNVVLNLHISAFFSSLVMPENPEAVSGMVGGDLSVFINGKKVQVFTLQQSGDQTLRVEFDTNLLSLPETGGVNNLRVSWDAAAACRMNLLTSVAVLPESALTFTYEEGQDTPSFNTYPVPFVMDRSLKPMVLDFVLPDASSSQELQAAMILAAGIGQISGGEQDVRFFYASGFQPDPDASIVLIAGNEQLAAADIQQLGDLPPVSLKAGDGALAIFKPAVSKFGLLVTGDAVGILKAAQMAAADQVIAVGDETLVVVSDVNPQPQAAASEDAYLVDLGAGDVLLTNTGGLSRSFDFYIPAGEQPRADSYFGLILSHSQQLDYLSSSLHVSLNGQPVASIRLNDNTAVQNLFQLILPSSLIHTGRNTITLTAELYLLDMCAEPEAEAAWLRVSGDSLLHLPLEHAVADSSVRMLADFPGRFLSGTRLDNVTLLVAAGDSGALGSAGAIAHSLGAALSQADPLQLKANWAEDTQVSSDEAGNLILIGSPAAFSMLADEAFFPTLKFDPAGVLQSGSGLEIVTTPPGGSELGYLAIRASGLDGSSTNLAILGNSPAGILAAGRALVTGGMADSNFAVIGSDGNQVSWRDIGIATGTYQSEERIEEVLAVQSDAPREFKRALALWAVPAIAGGLALLVGLLVLELRKKKSAS
jgi:hypothetical protein